MFPGATQLLTFPTQLEQFIETLFPSQNVNHVKALHAEQVNQSSSGDFWESLMLVATVLFFLLLVSGLMVRTRAFFGPC